LALQALRSGDCDAALVGAVSAVPDPEETAVLGEFVAHSQGDAENPLDSKENGYSEDIACAVVLKRHELAVADSDRIYSVLIGSAVSPGGYGAGTAELFQEAVMRSALKDAGVDGNMSPSPMIAKHHGI
jgi:acyl transferase domain-containing protein